MTVRYLTDKRTYWKPNSIAVPLYTRFNYYMGMFALFDISHGRNRRQLGNSMKDYWKHAVTRTLQTHRNAFDVPKPPFRRFDRLWIRLYA